MQKNDYQMVLHAGLMKTGTTYIQGILQKNREFLVNQRWRYPGSRENQQHAFYSICGNNIPWVTDRLIYNYQKIGADLIDVTSERKENLIISAESLASLNGDGIRHLIEKIGMPDKVVFSIRPLEKIFPSAWQQSLKSGGKLQLNDYFKQTLENRNHTEPIGFWREYGYGKIVELWKSIARCEIVAIIVPNSFEEPNALWMRFSKAACLPELPDISISQDLSNVSLSSELAEVLYLFNRDLNQSKGLEALRKRTEFLNKCILPVARRKAGSSIMLDPEEVAMLKLWNAQERDRLVVSADQIIGLSDL